MESALDVAVPKGIERLRRLLYCGEWIESHVLHIVMLHAPDFLGYPDAMTMAKDYPERVKQGLRIKKIGNKIVNLLGGREIHPINVKVGGFYKLLDKAKMATILAELKEARDLSIDLLNWVASFDIPDMEHDYEFIALKHETEYPFAEGRIVSTKGLDIAAKNFEDHIEEEHVEYSNALHAKLKERDNYFVGPLARYNLNQQKLPPLVKQHIQAIGFPDYCKNPFQSIIVTSH